MIDLTENAVKAPAEFYRLARAFHPDSRIDVKDEHEWIASALRHLDPPGRYAVKQFLTDLLRQNPDEAELQKLWNSAGSNYYIVGKHGNDGVRHVLTMIRDQIERRP
jgi:hypothetical protein